MEKKGGKGFTLIELLVVIAIIGILASVVIASIGSTRPKARDASRETEIKQIQNALNIYASNAKTFPICPAEVIVNGSSDCLSAALLGAYAMQGRVPTDPLGGSVGVCGAAGSYVYCYQSVNGTTYTLRYALETNTIQGKSAGWQNISP